MYPIVTLPRYTGRGGTILAFVMRLLTMDKNLTKLSSQQLRTLFLRESKKFLKTLDYSSSSINQDLKDQMLNEIRENMKEIMHLIDLKEQQEQHAN